MWPCKYKHRFELLSIHGTAIMQDPTGKHVSLRQQSIPVLDSTLVVGAAVLQCAVLERPSFQRGNVT